MSIFTCIPQLFEFVFFPINNASLSFLISPIPSSWASFKNPNEHSVKITKKRKIVEMKKSWTKKRTQMTNQSKSQHVQELKIMIVINHLIKTPQPLQLILTSICMCSWPNKSPQIHATNRRRANQTNTS